MNAPDFRSEKSGTWHDTAVSDNPTYESNQPWTLEIFPFLGQYFLEAPLELLDPLSLLRGVFSSRFFLATASSDRVRTYRRQQTVGGKKDGQHLRGTQSRLFGGLPGIEDKPLRAARERLRGGTKAVNG